MLDLESKNQIKNNNICILRLGYVGLTIAVVFANSGLRVLGIEKIYLPYRNLIPERRIFYVEGI